MSDDPCWAARTPHSPPLPELSPVRQNLGPRCSPFWLVDLKLHNVHPPRLGQTDHGRVACLLLRRVPQRSQMEQHLAAADALSRAGGAGHLLDGAAHVSDANLGLGGFYGPRFPPVVGIAEPRQPHRRLEGFLEGDGSAAKICTFSHKLEVGKWFVVSLGLETLHLGSSRCAPQCSLFKSSLFKTVASSAGLSLSRDARGERLCCTLFTTLYAVSFSVGRAADGARVFCLDYNIGRLNIRTTDL